MQRAVEARHQGDHQGQHQGDPRREKKVEPVVKLEDGTRLLPADLVVMAVGIKPNARARARTPGSRLAAASWSRHDAHSDPDVFAVGECAEFDGQVFGLVAPLYEMAKM